MGSPNLQASPPTHPGAAPSYTSSLQHMGIKETDQAAFSALFESRIHVLILYKGMSKYRFNCECL